MDAYIAGKRAGKYDSVKDIISAALAYEIIKKEKANYIFGSDRWYGRPKLDAAVQSDAKLRGAIKRAVIAASRNSVSTAGAE